MAIPLPETDPVLLREHVLRDTNNLEVFIPKLIKEKHLGSTSGSFESVSEIGLGFFDYDLVDIDSISETEQNYQSNGFIYHVNNNLSISGDQLIILVILLSIIILCSYLTFWFFSKYKTSKHFMKQKTGDLEDQPTNDSQLEYGSNSSMSYESDTVQATFTPARITSYKNLPEQVDSKILMNRLRID